jgi:hypothetical protein
MDLHRYGPFALVVAVAAALVATFSLMLVKAVGRVSQWTWLIDNTPPFVVTVAARAAAVTMIGVTFFTITAENYRLFGYAAVALAVATVVLIVRFDGMRRLYTLKVPEVDVGGNQARDAKGRLLFRNLIIGREADMLPDANVAIQNARKKHGGLSLGDFLAGYGARSVNNPEAAWPRELIARIANRMTLLLIGILICAVVGLYEAASAVEMSQRI